MLFPLRRAIGHWHPTKPVARRCQGKPSWLMLVVPLGNVSIAGFVSLGEDFVHALDFRIRAIIQQTRFELDQCVLGQFYTLFGTKHAVLENGLDGFHWVGLY